MSRALTQKIRLNNSPGYIGVLPAFRFSGAQVRVREYAVSGSAVSRFLITVLR